MQNGVTFFFFRSGFPPETNTSYFFFSPLAQPILTILLFCVSLPPVFMSPIFLSSLFVLPLFNTRLCLSLDHLLLVQSVFWLVPSSPVVPFCLFRASFPLTHQGGTLTVFDVSLVFSLTTIFTRTRDAARKFGKLSLVDTFSNSRIAENYFPQLAPHFALFRAFLLPVESPEKTLIPPSSPRISWFVFMPSFPQLNSVLCTEVLTEDGCPLLYKRELFHPTSMRVRYNPSSHRAVTAAIPPVIRLPWFNFLVSFLIMQTPPFSLLHPDPFPFLPIPLRCVIAPCPPWLGPPPKTLLSVPLFPCRFGDLVQLKRNYILRREIFSLRHASYGLPSFCHC